MAILSLMHVTTDPSFYKAEINNFVHWCYTNHLIINVWNTEEMPFDPKAISEHSLIVICNTHINQSAHTNTLAPTLATCLPGKSTLTSFVLKSSNLSSLWEG